MNTFYYIAKKIHQGKNEDKKVSQPIIRIARISIILAMIINIITLAVVTGFQNKVKNKVIGFGSHITVVKAGETSIYESSPLINSDSLVYKVKQIKGVKNIFPFAYKPALIQSEADSVFYQLKDKDTFQIQQEIHGVVLKGVDSTYDWSFFESNLIEGRIPNVRDSISHQEIIVSSVIAKNLNLEVGSSANLFFVKQVPVKLKYKVTGIFKTGLQEFDEQIILGDLRNVQQLNDWGIETTIRVADTLSANNDFLIYAETKGGNGNYRYDWGTGFDRIRGYTICPVKDTLFRVITSDFSEITMGFGEISSIPDTAYLKIQVTGDSLQPCTPTELDMGEIKRNYLNDDGTRFSVDLLNNKEVIFEYIDGTGSWQNYIGGYEVEVDNFKELENTAALLKQAIYYQENDENISYRVRTIEEDQQEIFLWLDFLDVNVIIILVMMLIIGAINMGSGLLVLILTKTSLIGLLKALGATNWSIRKLFLYQAIFIVIRGMVIGNIIGIGICLLQQYYTIIPLNPEVYYLDAVPIEIHFWHIIVLNIGTLVLCTAALIIPSWVITKISPVKTLKFN